MEFINSNILILYFIINAFFLFEKFMEINSWIKTKKTEENIELQQNQKIKIEINWKFKVKYKKRMHKMDLQFVENQNNCG